MYITTFYSFKGGVGRTMALVNVAVELANRGKRVVIVDFDLEAPGIDTFDLGRPSATRGIVDFVREYLDSKQAPHVEDFVFQAPDIGQNGGELWVMPSGAQDDAYASRLAALDWTDLYENHDGYLLFEDLKEQWRHDLNVDYVFVDSRTGYTDVGGICTRHLPDACVVLFFPNEQNLRGLRKVVRDIRAEKTRGPEEAIELHFAFSNVPDLDDEDEILDRKISEFRAGLNFERKPLFIHRHQSLALLNQVIFTKERPKSRLAGEYRDLMSEIVRYNAEDREGALDFIERIGAGSRHPPFGLPVRRANRNRLLPEERAEQTTRRLKQIESLHAEDGEVLFLLGRLRAYEGEDTSLQLLDRAIRAGYQKPEAYLARAEQRRFWQDDPDGASSDALEALQSPEVSKLEIRRAFRLLLPEHLDQAPTSVQELAKTLRRPLLTRGRGRLSS